MMKLKTKIAAFLVSLALVGGATAVAAPAANAEDWTIRYAMNGGSNNIWACATNVPESMCGFTLYPGTYHWHVRSIWIYYVPSAYSSSCYHVDGNEFCISKFAQPYNYYLSPGYHTVYRWQ